LYLRKAERDAFLDEDGSKELSQVFQFDALRFWSKCVADRSKNIDGYKIIHFITVTHICN
jgi:hypothetical protein